MKQAKLHQGVDELLITNELSEDNRLTLLNLKKYIQKDDDQSFLKGMELYTFLHDYKKQITKWLNTTEVVISSKLHHKSFTEVELKLIIFNIFAGVQEDIRSDDDIQ